MPIGKKTGEFSIQSQPNVFVFNINEEKTYKKQHDLKIEKYKISNAEPDWKAKREQLDKEYEKLKDDLEAILLNEKQTINESFDSKIANNEKDAQLAEKESLESLATDAKNAFPVPLINVTFNNGDTPSFTLGETEEEKRAKISEMANNSVSSSVAKFFNFGLRKYNINEIKKTTFSISFNRSDRDLISSIKENKKTFLGITLKSKNSPEFDAFQNSIRAFDTAFNRETALGTDYLSSTQKVNQLRDLLADIQLKSQQYLDLNSGWKFTSSGRLRVQMAKDAISMASIKLAALDKALEQAKNFEQVNETQRSEFINSHKEEVKDAVKQKFDNKNLKVNKTRLEKLNNADSKNSDALDKAEKDYKQKVLELEKEQQNYNKSALSEGSVISSSSSFGVSDKIAFEDLDANQQYDICNTQFANMIFEEKHNPFADHMEYVPNGTKPGELAINKKARENALPLRQLKQNLRNKDLHIPVTYTTDSLVTLANLQLYDTMTGVKRAKNDYQVNYEFVNKDGKHLPSSALESMGVEKLVAEGYSCFVTGIKADFLQAKQGGFAAANNFEFAQRSMIPLETADRIMGLDPAYVSSMINHGAHKTNENPSAFLSNSLSQTAKLISKRTTASMISDDPANWQKFNIMSTSSLKKNIASQNIDFRPIRPGHSLSKKKYPINGFVAQQAKYFDADLMAHLDMNIVSAETKKYEFDQVFNEKLLSEESLTISNKDIRTPEFNKFLESVSDDPKLTEIKESINKVLTMDTSDVLKYKLKYLTNDGISQKVPADNEYLKTQSCENDYDLQAAKVYSLIKEYTKDHGTELSDPASPASQLNAWKDKAYPKGSPAFNEQDPNAIIMKVNVDTETDSDLEFNGDADYLIGTKLSFSSHDYWGADDDADVAQKYGIDSGRKFYMKNFANEPLFTREPSIGDIKQGNIGNCYFLAYISSTIGADPSAIKDMIRDNDNGTVTCKFFNEHQQPIYITMNKTVPYVTNPSSKGELMDVPASGEQAPLWFHLLQKGYVLAGLRPVDRLKNRPTEMQKLHDIYIENAGGNKGDALDTIKDIVLQERFKTAGNKGQELINNSGDKIFRRIMDRAMYNMDGGEPKDVYKDFNGKNARLKHITTPNAAYTINMLRKIGQHDNPFCGEGLMNYSLAEFNVMKDLCKETASRLTMEKTRYSKDLEGKDFVELERINMDDILDTMNDVLKDPKSSALKAVDAQMRQDMFNEFSKQFRDYQMNDPQPTVLYVSRKDGQYSNYAQKLFTAVKNHTDKHHGINCSFNTKSLRLANGKELDLSFNSESISDGGHIDAHEFSVSGYKIDGNKKILYIRNPWGNSEKQVQNVELSEGNAKENISYSSLKKDSDVNTKDSGIFEVDLNDFMEFAHDISFLDDKPGLNKNEIEVNLTQQYLKMYQKKNPAQYDILMKKATPDKVMETVKASSIIQNLTHDVFDLNEYREKIEDGIDLSEAELKDMDKLEKELDKVFISQPQKTAAASKDLSKQQDELSADNKGISAH